MGSEIKEEKRPRLFRLSVGGAAGGRTLKERNAEGAFCQRGAKPLALGVGVRVGRGWGRGNS